MVTVLKRKAEEEDYDLDDEGVKEVEENKDNKIDGDDDDNLPLNALKPTNKKKRGRPPTKNKATPPPTTTTPTPTKKKRGRPKKEDSPNKVVKVYASPNQKNPTPKASITKNKTTTAKNNNKTPLKATPKGSSPRPSSSTTTTTTTTKNSNAASETTSPVPTKKRNKNEKGTISVTITPEMIESITKYSVSELMHKPSKWIEAQNEPLRRLFTMIQEDPEYYGFKKNNTTTASETALLRDNNHNSNAINKTNNNKENDEEDETVMVGNHTLVRMEGTRRGKCNFVMVDPEDGELVQCGNITRFRCKECSERAGRNRYFCIDVEEDGLHSKSCFHLHRTLEYCKLAQHAGSIL